MLNMTAQAKSQYSQVEEMARPVSSPDEPKMAIDSGGTSDTDGSALIRVVRNSSSPIDKSLDTEKEDGASHTAGGRTMTLCLLCYQTLSLL
jgi:hypothetical protein